MANRTSRPRMREDEAEKLIVEQGYRKTNIHLHGRSVYYNPKQPNNIQYITYDVDGHNGGVWKAGNKKWAEGGGRSASRSGTYDENLNRIGD